MARELPEERQALPVFKVLYRNTRRMQECGGRSKEVLHPVAAAELPKDRPGGELLREATRRADFDAAEGTFAALAHGPIGEAYNHLQFSIQDEVDVHRVVLAWRSWAVLDLTGKDYARTLLRQSVRYCVEAEKELGGGKPAIRTVLPKLLDQYHLVGRPIGDRQAEDAWIEHLAQTVYASSPAQAADAAAAALAEGMSPEAVGEAISLAANRLVLCDPGRKKDQASAGKPEGSVHGASVGVHASDSANAWRNMARAANLRNTYACLILGAFQVAYDRTNRGGDFQHWQPHPIEAELEPVKASEAATLLSEAESAIRESNQLRACAVVHKYGTLGHEPRPLFDLLLRFATSEDGALHAEKYYRTVSEEFARTRPAFRWRQLVSLARVTASEYGRPAAGYAEACQLLRV
jgi:hypothetical protein